MNISVCMTSYNGGDYIKQQIDSIIHQIGSDDEIIICDDRSTDNTVEIINSIGDNRIKLFVNAVNLGVIKNYAECLNKAKNDLIFLSDQDDIWMENKVDEIKREFAQNPRITLVLSNATVIDGKGKLIQPSFLKLTDGQSLGGMRAVDNIVKNKYLGGAIAFKRNMLKYILPFPPTLPMHDMWIGILNDIYGKTSHISKPLIQYRRHGNNVSPYKHKNILWRLQWRANLVYCICQALWERRNVT